MIFYGAEALPNPCSMQFGWESLHLLRKTKDIKRWLRPQITIYRYLKDWNLINYRKELKACAIHEFYNRLCIDASISWNKILKNARINGNNEFHYHKSAEIAVFSTYIYTHTWDWLIIYFNEWKFQWIY